MTLAERIRDTRRAHGLTQERIAVSAGVSLRAYRALESGEATDPHYSTLRQIASVLGVTVAELVGEPVLSGKAQAPPETAEVEERRFLMDAIQLLAAYLDEEDAVWKKKLADDVYELAELETALASWNRLWAKFGDRLTQERARGIQGKKTLSDETHAACADLLTQFGLYRGTLQKAEENPRFSIPEELTDLRHRRSGEAG